MTGWIQPRNTITTKQIKEHFNLVTPAEVFTTRRKLEILGYIEPVRKGAQTYHLRKSDLPGLLGLSSEYVATNYTYTMPIDYRAHILLPLSTMTRQFEKWDSGNWGAHSKSITIAYNDLKRATDILPSLAIEAIQFSFTFICPPIYDTLMNDFGRQKRIANLANLIERTGNELKDVYRFSLTGSDLITIASILNQIKVPNILETRKSKP